jgi:CBS domain-containing protein
MHVEHFMTKDPVACDVHEPIEGAARLMRDKGVGCVVVLRNGKVAGLVTDRQIAVNAVADGIAPDAPVEEIMTSEPALLTMQDNVFSAIDTMRSAGVVRRLPVVNANRELVGIVSISDVAVIAKDLIDHILLDESHSALQEAHLLTGAKRMVKEIRRPTKLDRLPEEQETLPVTHPTPGGVGASTGAAEPPRKQKKAPSEREASRGPR